MASKAPEGSRGRVSRVAAEAVASLNALRFPKALAVTTKLQCKPRYSASRVTVQNVVAIESSFQGVYARCR